MSDDLSSPQKVHVALGENSYDILIGRSLLQKAGQQLKKLGLTRQLFILTDERVAEYHLKSLKLLLTKAKIPHHAIVLPAGEQSKNFTTAEKILNEILSQKPERQCAI